MYTPFAIIASETGNSNGKPRRMSFRSEGLIMKGYFTESGYMGYVDGSYILFSCEDDYLDYVEETAGDAA